MFKSVTIVSVTDPMVTVFVFVWYHLDVNQQNKTLIDYQWLVLDDDRILTGIK